MDDDETDIFSFSLFCFFKSVSDVAFKFCLLVSTQKKGISKLKKKLLSYKIYNGIRMPLHFFLYISSCLNIAKEEIMGECV